MTQKKILVWFRNDLRLTDHEALSKAASKGKVLPVYCFDTRHFQNTSLGFPKTNAYRAQFLIEAVHNLRENLKPLGADLIVRIGHPEQVIADLAKENGITDVYASKEVTTEEIKLEATLEKALWQKGIPLTLFWQSTLIHMEDLPFPIGNLPDQFTEFRKQIEKQVRVRTIINPPKQFFFIDGVASGVIPDLATLEVKPLPVSEKAVFQFKGGETAAQNRVNEYLWETHSLETYKETRNGLLGANYSSKFSPWLSLGCITPKIIFEEVKRYERERVTNESTYWLIFELLWRDYFRFVAKKYGSKIFQANGFRNKAPEMYDDHFQAWKIGKTGIPFIDANIRELNQTGFMSNRGRQIVASFLINDLQVNWTWGAAYFESMLIDYDVCSNWGNWCYLAGVGNDPRQDRYFNIISQARKYDPSGDYIRQWIPEIGAIKGFKIHQPAALSKAEIQELDFELGKDYPHSIISMERWEY